MEPISPVQPGRRVVRGPGALAVLALASFLHCGAVGAAHAAWAKLDSEPLGITLDYPVDWRVDAAATGAVFRSPRGETIELKRLEATVREPESPTLQCTTGRLRGGGSVRTCWDPMSTVRIAYVTLAPGPNVRPWVLVTTDKRSDPRIFDRMVDSLRLRPGSRPR